MVKYLAHRTSFLTPVKIPGSGNTYFELLGFEWLDGSNSDGLVLTALRALCQLGMGGGIKGLSMGSNLLRLTPWVFAGLEVFFPTRRSELVFIKTDKRSYFAFFRDLGLGSLDYPFSPEYSALGLFVSGLGLGWMKIPQYAMHLQEALVWR